MASAPQPSAWDSTPRTAARQPVRSSYRAAASMEGVQRAAGALAFAVLAVLSYAAETAADRTDTRESWRSFFGVLKQSETYVPSVGRVKMLVSEGLTGLVIETMQPVAVPDAPVHPRFKFFPETHEERYRSFLGVPVLERRAEALRRRRVPVGRRRRGRRRLGGGRRGLEIAHDARRGAAGLEQRKRLAALGVDQRSGLLQRLLVRQHQGGQAETGAETVAAVAAATAACRARRFSAR